MRTPQGLKHQRGHGGGGNATKDLSTPAGNWRGQEAELDLLHELPPGKQLEERAEPRLCQKLMLPGRDGHGTAKPVGISLQRGKSSRGGELHREAWPSWAWCPESDHIRGVGQPKPPSSLLLTRNGAHAEAEQWQQAGWGQGVVTAQTRGSFNILLNSVKPKDVKEYLKHFTEELNVVVSRDLEELRTSLPWCH